jgi:tRNA1Val (adenine37-N6)-methyltransferase
MKVGTDGVLLGAWATLHNAGTILDIGTGSGVIALMLAQRTSPTCVIDAVELEHEDAGQARENVAASPWPDKVHVHTTSIQHFVPSHQYDLIISNPPFFINSQEPPDARRIQARHTVSLSYEDLLQAVVRLLKPSGTFQVVLPYLEGLHFITLASSRLLYCTRQWSFRTRPEKPVERLLLEFSFQDGTLDTGEILLYDTGDAWSDQYKMLTKSFYLQA